MSILVVSNHDVGCVGDRFWCCSFAVAAAAEHSGGSLRDILKRAHAKKW